MDIDLSPYSPDPLQIIFVELHQRQSFPWNPNSIENLKPATQTVIESIETSTLQRVMQNFAIRLRHIIDTDGRHMEHAFNKFPCIVLCFRILIQFFESVVFKKLIFNISESPCITNYPVIILYNLLIIPCHLQKNLINLFLYKMHFNKRFY